MNIEGPDEGWLPYAQQPDESSRQFAQFKVYRDMGPTRTLQGAARKMGAQAANLHKLVKLHDWHGRARAWDAECDRAWRQAVIQKQREVLDEHRALAAAMRHKAASAVNFVTELSADDIVKWVNTATRLEQAAYQLPVGANAGQSKTAEQVYFDSLDGVQIVRLGREALATLEKGSQP